MSDANQPVGYWRRVIIPVVLMLALIACGLDYFVNDKRDRQTSNELDTHGAKTSGLLDNEFTMVTRRYGRTDYQVTYAFQVDNVTYHGTSNVDQLPLNANRNVVIRYLPSDPKVNRLEDPQFPHEAHFWGDIGMAIAGVVVVTLMVSYINWLRRRRLIK